MTPEPAPTLRQAAQGMLDCYRPSLTMEGDWPGLRVHPHQLGRALNALRAALAAPADGPTKKCRCEIPFVRHVCTTCGGVYSRLDDPPESPRRVEAAPPQGDPITEHLRQFGTVDTRAGTVTLQESAPTLELLRAMADWFDNPNESPTIGVVLRDTTTVRYTPGFLLRRIEAALREAQP